jgi:DNA-binding protein HU-beta
MNKAELIDSVLKNMGKDTTKKAAGDAVEAVLDAIAAGIKKDKVVQLIGFGTFKVTQRAARKGRNPKTGETIKIKASKSVRFGPSSSLKGKL